MDAYSLAVEYLVAGAMPIIVEVDDEIHVLSVIPTSRETLFYMLHEDTYERMKFVVRTVVAVKNVVEEANI